MASITYNSINRVNATIKYGKLHRALWGHPHPLQTTYIFIIYIHTGGSIEHNSLPHANAFGNNMQTTELVIFY